MKRIGLTGILLLALIAGAQTTATLTGNARQICVDGVGDTTRTAMEGIFIRVYNDADSLLVSEMTNATGSVSFELETMATYYVAACKGGYISAPLVQDVYLTGTGGTVNFDMMREADIDLDCDPYTVYDVRAAKDLI